MGTDQIGRSPLRSAGVAQRPSTIREAKGITHSERTQRDLTPPPEHLLHDHRLHTIYLLMTYYLAAIPPMTCQSVTVDSSTYSLLRYGIA